MAGARYPKWKSFWTKTADMPQDIPQVASTQELDQLYKYYGGAPVRAPSPPTPPDAAMIYSQLVVRTRVERPDNHVRPVFKDVSCCSASC